MISVADKMLQIRFRLANAAQSKTTHFYRPPAPPPFPAAIC